MFGELKGGIDPAGADEHWKTGNSALVRIRKAFEDYQVLLSKRRWRQRFTINYRKEYYRMLPTLQ